MPLTIVYHTIIWRDDFTAALRDVAGAGFTAFSTFSLPPRVSES